MLPEDDIAEQIAGDLHDGVVQWLVGAKMQAEAIKYRLASGQSIEPERVERLISSLTRGIQDARHLMNGLSGPPINDGRWTDALRLELADVARQTEFGANPECQLIFNINESVNSIPLDSAKTAYRIIREAVWNAMRHAKSTVINVNAQCIDGLLMLEVSDNGTGFDLQQTSKTRKGVAGMIRRAERAGGNATLESTETGTCLKVKLPV